MPAMADIVLNNGSATPVAKTFKAKSVVGTLAKWEERSSGVPIGYIRLSLETKDSPTTRRVKVNVSKPALEAVSGSSPLGFVPAPTLAYTLQGSADFTMSNRASDAEKADVLAFLTNALANALFKGAINNGDEIIG